VAKKLMPKIAQRMGLLGTESAFEVLAKAKALERQGREILHFEIGEPDFDTPENIKEAAIKALRDGYTHYCPAPGIPQLREAIAEHIANTRKIPVSPEEVIVTPGAKPIMFYGILACVDPGDEVIYPNPGFPIYESVINFVGARPVPVPLLEERGFSFDMDIFEKSITSKTRMIILNSPQNPTGGMLLESDLKRIAEVAKERNIWILSDEIYDQMLYKGQFVSITTLADVKDQTIILNGFSKTYAMTGWRMGYGVMPEELAKHVTRLIINCNSCTATFQQVASVEALKGPQDAVAKMVAEFKQRRDLIVSGLNQIPGISCQVPQGAFYVFPNIKGFQKPASQISDYLLDKAGIAVLSGTAFGKYGEGYLRFSYANSQENIKKMLKRLGEALTEFK
jgi:aspartate/methionine/tyrosine aminotransferase